jgi:hypothetical protein
MLALVTLHVALPQLWEKSLDQIILYCRPAVSDTQAEERTEPTYEEQLLSPFGAKLPSFVAKVTSHTVDV